MTINDTPNPATDSPAEPPDPRPGFHAACRQAQPVIGAVTADDLRRPTPCDEFDVEDLTRHLLSIGHRVIGIAEGAVAETIPLDAPEVATTALAADWDHSLTVLEERWRPDAVLGHLMVLPFGTMPGAFALGVYTAEVLIHTWDLAAALGLQTDWDQALAAACVPSLQQGIPAEGRGPEMPFDPVVPTAADAPAMDQLVAWVGRDPAWGGR